MSNQGTVRNEAQMFQTTLLENTTPNFVRYYGQVVGAASAQPTELFFNGVPSQRLVLPTDSYIFGEALCAAWNITDGDVPVARKIIFGIENDGGTVAVSPTGANAFGTSIGNPDNFRTGETGGTFTIVANNTLKCVQVMFQAANNKTYKCNVIITYAFAAAAMRLPQFRSVTA